jgi:hypothetical protein
MSARPLKVPLLAGLFARVSFSDYRIEADFTVFCAGFSSPILRGKIRILARLQNSCGLAIENKGPLQQRRAFLFG